MCNPSRALRCWFPLALTLKEMQRRERLTVIIFLHTGCSKHQALWGYQKLRKYPRPAFGVPKRIKVDRKVYGKKGELQGFKRVKGWGMRAMEELEKFDWVKVAVGGITAQISTSQADARENGRESYDEPETSGLEMVGKYATASTGWKLGCKVTTRGRSFKGQQCLKVQCFNMF